MRMQSPVRLPMTAALLAMFCGVAGAAPEPVLKSGATPVAEQERATDLAVRVRLGNQVRPATLRVLTPGATSSKAIPVGADGTRGARSLLVTNQVVVRLDGAEHEEALHAAVAQVAQTIPGARVAFELGDSGISWAVEAPNVGAASRVADSLSTLDFVTHAAVDSGPWIEMPSLDNQQKMLLNHQEKVRALVAPGVAPVGMPGAGAARGGADPLVGDQWWLNNTLNPGRDLNVDPVYNLGFTGAGVTVGVVGISEGAIQPDHIDFGGRFDQSISQPANPNAGFDALATFYAGLIGAEADNGIGGQGIAPGVRLASMIFGTDIREAQSYEWQNQEIDIKVHTRVLDRYFAPDDGYSPGQVADYVMIGLENSLRLGRGGKGTVHVFSTGYSGTLNSPYEGSGDPWQDIFDSVGSVGVTATNSYLTAPLYPGGQIHNYPPAAHRSTFVIAGVGEDNNTDPFSTIGAAVFASVYSSSFNEFLSGPGISRPLVSTVPEDDFETEFLDPFNGAPAAIAAGVFALMLEANPDLSVRDIQHIIADTAVITDLGYDFFNPYVTSVPVAIADGGTSNWNSNGEFQVHSDQFGFGLIDADAAVEAALNYTPPGRLYVLDSGIREAEVTIPNATIIEQAELSSVYQFFTSAVLPFCIRENFQIEAIEVELSITGAGSNDLMIHVESPYGTLSNLHYPLTVNPSGTTFDPPNNDDNADTQAFSNVTFNGTAYAFYRHKFTTYKHWDELSGGRWYIRAYDMGPDEQLPEGEEETDTEPAIDHVTSFVSPLAVPPNQAREEHVIDSYRVRIFGTSIGEPVFTGCAPGETNCPGDIDGDGIVTPADFNLFLSHWLAGDLLADINNDGSIDFADIVLFNGLWSPGPCGRPAFVNGRPSSSPGGINSNDDAIIRPF